MRSLSKIKKYRTELELIGIDELIEKTRKHLEERDEDYFHVFVAVSQGERE